MHSLQLRVASRNLWQSSPHVANIHNFLLSAAQSLFQQVVILINYRISVVFYNNNIIVLSLLNFFFQIIFSHKKSFEADKYAAIKSIISSVQEKMITVFLLLCEYSTVKMLQFLLFFCVEFSATLYVLLCTHLTYTTGNHNVHSTLLIRTCTLVFFIFGPLQYILFFYAFSTL